MPSGGYLWSNKTYTDTDFKVNINQKSGYDVGVVFRMSGGPNDYLLRCSGVDNGNMVIIKETNGAPTLLGQVYVANRAGLNQWYTLRVAAVGNQLHGEYILNGVVTAILDVTDASFASGSVGFRATGGDYRFDDALMGAKTSYSYDAANELAQITDGSGIVTALGYDTAGNNTSETTGSITTSRTYDERNRLTSVTGGGLNVSYSYDGLGSLLQRNNLNLPSPNNATRYRYNDVTGALSHEFNSTGTVKAAYVTDDKGNPVSVTRYGLTYFYHTNAHGDVIAIIDSSSGNQVATFTYDPWGNPTEYNGTTGSPEAIGTWAPGATPGDGLFFLFGSMLYDAATGLYLTKTRAYNPKTGRFLQRDILDESGKNGVYKGFPFGKDAIGTNLYAWCGKSLL